MKENLVSDRTCKGCRYYRKFYGRQGGWGLGGLYACHYCVDTGNLRGCTVEACDKKRGRRKKGPPNGGS